MKIGLLNHVLWGSLAMASWIAGLFFLRYWKASRDRLFVFFSIAFWLMSLNWLGLALIEWATETRYHVYLLRLLSFILIIIGIIDKNRRAKTQT